MVINLYVNYQTSQMSRRISQNLIRLSLLLGIAGCAGHSSHGSYGSHTIGHAVLEHAGIRHPVRGLASDVKNPLKSLQVTSLWTQKMPGAISSMSLASYARLVLVATTPDPDIVGSARTPLLSLLSAQGKVLWRKTMTLPVKEQDLAADGSLVVVSNYSGELTAWDRHGTLLWQVEGNCRPQILRRSKKILCYHDDDADPRTAFDLLDWDGHKLATYQMSGTEDVLALKLALDEKHLVLGLTSRDHGSQMAYFRLDTGGGAVSVQPQQQPAALALTPEWIQTLPGEVVDVAVASAVSDAMGDTTPVAAAVVRVPFAPPLVAAPTVVPSVLPTQKGDGHSVVLLGAKGVIRSQFKAEIHLDQIEFSGDSSKLYFYSNHETGQQWGAWQWPQNPQPAWLQMGTSPSEYSSYLTVASVVSDSDLKGETLWAGYEVNGVTEGNGVRSHLLAFSPQGDTLADIALGTSKSAKSGKPGRSGVQAGFPGLPIDEEAHLYVYRIGPGVVAVATDDGRVSLLGASSLESCTYYPD
jgi:hypothetical protein